MPDPKLPPAGLREDVIQEDIPVVVFSLGEQYGVPIVQVQEIVRVGHITRVPNSPPYMEGVINLRGRVLPVLNLRKRLGLPGKELTKASRVVVSEVGQKVIGLLVDSVLHVLKMPASSIEEPPEDVLEVDTDYITGVSRLQDRLVIMLDLERLLRREPAAQEQQ
jgi:purine-binding chemotaxis protein CheW